MQFAWIARVNDSQREAQLASLRGSLRLVISQLHEEMLLLLSTFAVHGDFDSSQPLEVYRERYQSWRQMSLHPPSVQRILFLDLRGPKGEALTELKGESRAIEPAEWGNALTPLRQHIRKVGFKAGRSLNLQGSVTWMLYPQPMAVYRPIGQLRRNSTNRIVGSTVTGYLILQLNQDAIRDQLIPKVLDVHFGNLASPARYAVTFAVDGKSHFRYEPSDNIESAAHTDSGGAVNYRPRTSRHRLELEHAKEVSDQSLPFLLLSGSLRQPVMRRGAIQQVAIQSSLDILRAIRPNPEPPGLDTGLGTREADLDSAYRAPRTLATTPTRLFLVGDRPHQAMIEARHVGSTLEEAINREYLKSVAMGTLVLLLLVGSMVMVAVSGIGAAKQAEAQVEAVASQAHHLRTPLAAISALSESLAGGNLKQGDDVVEHAGLIREYGQRLNEIVERTLHLAAIRSLKRSYQLTMVDVSKEADEALEEIMPILDGAEFASERSLAEGLPLVWADAAALRQCVGELLGNAVKYGLPGRWVKIETAEYGTGRKRTVRIRVHDRGQGVPQREVRRIFEPYYRVAGPTNSAIRGSGLGLTLVLRTVEEMGDQLTHENGEDGGSVFTIHLPVPV